MRVGIVSHYYKSDNYGGNLQAYALCRAINNMGHSAEQIAFDRKKDMGLIRKVKFMLSDMMNGLKHSNRSISDDVLSRKNAIGVFNLLTIPHSKRVYSEKNISECVNDYDVFITGSDQVWHPLAVCDAYLLKFVPDNKVKISYAASVACDALSCEVKLRYKSAFKSFDSISVREKASIVLIDDIFKGDIHWSLDPTLLLDKNEWLGMAEPSQIDEDYVFCYFLGDSETARELAKAYARKNCLKIVTLPFLCGTFMENDKDFGDIKLYDVSPQRLISLINEARFVFTDSFHATVFSLILNKEFCVLPRDGINRMASRIYDLLSIFELPERFCDNEKKIKLEYVNVLRPINYNRRFEQYETLKEESLLYLKENIEKGAK